MTLARRAALALIVCAASAPSADDKALRAGLEAKTQALADAIALGDNAPGQVTGFGDRRERLDIKWRRLS